MICKWCGCRNRPSCQCTCIGLTSGCDVLFYERRKRFFDPALHEIRRLIVPVIQKFISLPATLHLAWAQYSHSLFAFAFDDIFNSRRRKSFDESFAELLSPARGCLQQRDEQRRNNLQVRLNGFTFILSGEEPDRRGA